MNTKFRKKPVVIEAFQMTKERCADLADWPDWLLEAWMLDRGTPGSLYPTKAGMGDGTVSIGTLEGQLLVSFGDWIIKGVKGELYPCKPDIFEATYEVDKGDRTDNEITPKALGSNAGLGGFFTETMLASATLDGEQEGRAYRGYCPKCGNHTLKSVHRKHGIIAKVCNTCDALVVLKDR